MKKIRKKFSLYIATEILPKLWKYEDEHNYKCFFVSHLIDFLQKIL